MSASLPTVPPTPPTLGPTSPFRRPTPPTLGPTSTSGADIAELYVTLAPRLEQLVRLAVDGSDALVEDACQFAWDRLVSHRHRVRHDTALWWLARTALREASKLLHREQRYLSLDEVVAVGGDRGVNGGYAGPEELVLQRERLDSVALLPHRQQQMLWLHALGLSYTEIADRMGSTVRTVERQLLRAKRAMRAADAPVSAANPAPAAPRAAVRTRRSALAA